MIEDLKALEKKGYLLIDKNSDNVKLTSLIGYKLDMHKLFVKLALKLKE